MRRRPRIGDILLEHGLVEQDALDLAVDLQQQKGGRLGQILLDEGIVSPVALLRGLARQFDVELVDLEEETIEPDAVGVISPALARRHRALPIRWDDDLLVVAMANPADLVAIDDIRAVAGQKIKPVMAESGQLQEAINRWSHDKVTGAPSPRVDARTDKASIETAHIRFVDAVLGRAIAERASDIHLEPAAEGLRVRFRVDGVMRDVFTAPRGNEAGVVSRLKVLAEMDISERRLPQDGRTGYAVDGKTVDLRVATVPTILGEAAVIRILDHRAEIARLDDLGFTPANLEVLRAAIRRPWGAVLVTGPTGSGKTTTLYGALRELNDPVRNVITVEDPVEITMDGIKQVQVNPRAGLTFASALRSFLRADPDVVLIGEIRDVETATIASEAALTGHLVLSTIHTNDVCSTPLRLLEMGVEPFLVASALQCVVAQRLARRLCERCKIPYEPGELELVDLGWDRSRLLDGSTPTLHRAGGCAACNDTGYRDRIAVHEVLAIDDELAAGLGRRISVDEVRRLAMAQGMRTIREDGLLKVARGLTSVEELNRVLA